MVAILIKAVYVAGCVHESFPDEGAWRSSSWELVCKVFGDISREEREDRADDGKDESSDKQPATAESRGDGEVRAIRVSKQREIDDGFERQDDS